MKKTFYETMWSLLEKQGILQKWFDEGLLVTKKNTTFWTPKALEILELEASIGGVNLSDQEPKKTAREVTSSVVVGLLDWVEEFTNKFSAKNIGIAGKGGNVKAIVKKMHLFLAEYDYTKEEILAGVDLYLDNLKRTNSMAFVQEAHYFINKLHNGVQISNLAKWCDEVRNGNNKRYTSHTIL
jgi:hypothetical protein